MAKQATAEKRQRRERGSINPDDIIKGAFELAEEVGIDNLSMPLLGKHLGVGVTSIYWYFRKKDDLLNAMTDRALTPVRLRHALCGGQGLARDAAQSRAHHAKDVHGQPDSVRPDPHSVSAEPAGGTSSASPKWRRPSTAWSRRGCRRRTPSTPTPRFRSMCADRWCCSGFTRRTGRRPRTGRSDFEEAMIDRRRDRAVARAGDREGPPHWRRPTRRTSSTAWSASSTTPNG